MNAEAEKKSRREENTVYKRETRVFLRGLERCTECGAKDAYTMNGRWLCAECAEKHGDYNHAYYERQADVIADRRKALRSYRREHRLCTVCGKALTEACPYSICEACRAANRRKNGRLRREKGIIPRLQWRELGLCMRCGAPRMKGWLAWEHKEIELCEKCYSESVDGLAKGRAIYAEKKGTTYGNFEYEYLNLIRHGEGNKENRSGEETDGMTHTH